MAFIIDGTTGIATVDGSVSAPSQRGQDSNSGISYAADTIKFSTNGVERMAITNSGVTGITQGKLLQAVSHTLSSTFTTTSTTMVDVTGMSKAITPIAASSKILVIFSLDLDNENGSTGDVYGAVKIQRSVDGGSYSNIKGQIQGGRDMGDGSQYTPNSLIILDAPSYSLGNAITYKLQAQSLHASNTISITQSTFPRTSNIVLLEIGA